MNRFRKAAKRAARLTNLGKKPKVDGVGAYFVRCRNCKRRVVIPTKLPITMVSHLPFTCSECKQVVIGDVIKVEINRKGPVDE